MAQVPMSQRQVASKVIQAGTVSADVKTDAFGGGAAMEKMGNALVEAVKGAGDLTNKVDDLEADRAIAEAKKRKNKQLYGDPSEDKDGKPSGYYNEQGKNASINYDEHKRKLSESIQEIESGLSNERQRRRFQDAMVEMDVEVDGQMKRHALGEAQKYDQQETAASIAIHQDDAALNYNQVVPGPDGRLISPIRGSIAKQEELIIGFAGRQGYAPDSNYTKQKVIEAKTITHKGVIERMLANDEDRNATEYLKQVKELGEIDGGAIADLDRVVEAGTLRGESQRVSDKIMKSTDSMGKALEMAREIEDPKLRDEITQRVKVRFAEKNAITDEMQEKKYESIIDHVEQHGSRDKIPMDQFLSLKASQQSAIDNYIQSKNSGKLQVTNWEKYTELRMMAATPATQAKFAKMDLFTEARKHLADAEYKEIVKLKMGVLKGDPATLGQLDGYRSDADVINTALAAVKITKKDKPELYMQASAKLDKLVAQYKQSHGGKTVPNEVLQKMVETELVQGAVPGTGFLGMFKTKKRIFEVGKEDKLELDIDTIPKETLGQIKKALERAGRPTTDKNIIDTFVKARKL